MSVYIYRWNRMGRKGQRCVVLARGAMNSCRVLFEDGFEAITSRNALKKAFSVKLTKGGLIEGRGRAPEPSLLRRRDT
jgi:hypothetical protein